MSVTEAERAVLRTALTEEIGQDPADILMRSTHPQGSDQLATKDDVTALATQIEGESAKTEGGFAKVAGEFAAVHAKMDGEFKAIDSGFEAVNAKMDGGFEAVNAKVDGGFAKVDGEFKAVNAKMDGGFEAINAKVDGGFEAVNAKMDGGFEAVNAKVDGGFAKVDGEFKAVDSGFAAVNAKVDGGFAKVEGEFKAVHHKVDGGFEAVHHKVDGGFEAVHHKVDGGFEAVHHKVDGAIQETRGRSESMMAAQTRTVVLWIAGMMLTTWVAMAIALVSLWLRLDQIAGDASPDGPRRRVPRGAPEQRRRRHGAHSGCNSCPYGWKWRGLLDDHADRSLDAPGAAVRQLREDMNTKADAGSFDAQFQRLELTLGQLVELVWHLSEVIGTRLDDIEARLTAGGL